MKVYGLGHIDTMCGFKGYHQKVAQNLFKDLIDNRWLFDTEIAYKATRLKYSVNSFPVNWESKDGSKLSGASLIKSALNIYPLIRAIDRNLRNTV
jgi:dolichyl-phosphate beta-glucosyltransferase